MKKKIGIYGGSFNPIHHGHIGVAKYVKEYVKLDEVWLMVSPNNPLKDSKILAPEKERLEGVKNAIKDIPCLVACDFEFYLPKPSYTADTLKALVKHAKNIKRKGEITYDCEFSLIIGEDSLATLPQWKDYEYIVNNFTIYVYPRHGVNSTQVKQIPIHENIKILYDAPYIDISSTEIRNKNKNNKNMKAENNTNEKVNEALQFADEVFQKVLSDTKQKEWFESLDNLEKSRVEFMSKAIALQVRADLSLKLEPIEIENGPKPVLGWYD